MDGDFDGPKVAFGAGGKIGHRGFVPGVHRHAHRVPPGSNDLGGQCGHPFAIAGADTHSQTGFEKTA